MKLIMTLLFKYVILVLLISMFVFSNSFSTGGHPGGAGSSHSSSDNSESDEEREDREWEENFEDKFEEDPTQGFQRDEQRAWGTISNDPEILTRSPDMAQIAADNNAGAFVAVIDDGNRDLLSDANVRTAYESLISQEPRYAQAYPDTLNTFLGEEGIEASFGLENGEIELVSYTMEGSHRFIEFRQIDGDNRIVASVESLQGTTISPNGEVVYPSGEIIRHGEIGREIGSNEISLTSIDSSPVIAQLNDIEFRADEFMVGLADSSRSSYVRATGRDVQFQDNLGRDARLISGSRLSVDENQDLGLNGELRVGRITQVNELDVYEPLRVFKTDFQSNSQEMRITTNPSSCSGVSNCIVDQERVLQINVENQREFEVQLYGNEDLAVTVNHISDESSVLLTRMSGEARVDFRINRENTEKIGFFSGDSGLTLLTFHEGGHRGVDQGIYGHVFNAENPDGIRLNDVQFEPGIDLSRFDANVQELLRNVDFTSIPQNQASIVAALNSLGLPNDMEFRRQLAQELGIENYRGTASQNTELLNKLREGEFSASRAVNVGFQNPEIFELNPEFLALQQQAQEIGGCQVTGGYDCQIGRFRYQLLEDGTFLARDGERFDPNNEGALVNNQGQFVDRQGNVCSQACAWSSQRDAFRGGEFRNLNDPVQVSTSGSLEIGAITVRGSNTITNRHIPPENLPPALREHFPQGTTTEDLLIRTIIGETRGYSDDAMEGVAAVMINRALYRGQEPHRVVLQRAQFSPWNPATGHATNSNIQRVYRDMVNEPITSAEYQRAQAALQRATQRDITGGADHFYAPAGMPGGRSPSWASRLTYVHNDGVHRFMR